MALHSRYGGTITNASVRSYIFFFQAEDGIRDLTVTGVQTCALPISAGVDATVIRNWLGHARLDTTNLYARANLETKRKALEQVDPATKPSKPPRWKQDRKSVV